LQSRGASFIHSEFTIVSGMNSQSVIDATKPLANAADAMRPQGIPVGAL
jgi:hypothetical protein